MRKHSLILIVLLLVLLYFLFKKTTTQVTSTIAGRPISGSGVPVTTSPISSIFNSIKSALGIGTTVAAGLGGATKVVGTVGPTLSQLGGGVPSPTPGIDLQPTLAQLTNLDGNNPDPFTDPTLGDLPLTSGVTASLDPLQSSVDVPVDQVDSSVYDYPGTGGDVVYS